MDLYQFIRKITPHGIQNSAPPHEIYRRHLWESFQLFSIKDCLSDYCSILDYGCGGKGTLQYTLFRHYPNSKYYGLDIDKENLDNMGFIENASNENKNVYFGNITELESILPKVDAMVMGSVFTHLSLSKMIEVLDKTLPHYERGFQLGFTAFLGEHFMFNQNMAYGDDPDTWDWTVLKFDWFEKYCDKNNLEIILHPYFYKTYFELPYLQKQNFMTIKKGL